MTERSARRRGPAGMPGVATAAFAGFLVLLAFLAFQMRAGRDPVLKPTVAAQQPQTVLHRRIIKTRVIVIDPQPRNGSAAAGSSGTSGLPAASAPAVVRTPAQPAPVPSPPPAPITRTS
jgi:hypothetical protein